MSGKPFAHNKYLRVFNIYISFGKTILIQKDEILQGTFWAQKWAHLLMNILNVLMFSVIYYIFSVIKIYPEKVVPSYQKYSL